MFNGKPICFVDLETTGGSPYKNKIIEIAIIKCINGKIIETYNKLVNPEQLVSQYILDMTGIDQSELNDAPIFADLASEIIRILDQSLFVAHNASFDYGFLRQEFGSLGVQFITDTLCSAKFSNRLFPEYKRHNLDEIIKRFDLDVKNRHRAYDDAEVIYQMFDKLPLLFDKDQLNQTMQSLIVTPNIPKYLELQTLDMLPKGQGVYIFYDSQDIPIFANKSRNIKSSVGNHFINTGVKVTKLDRYLAQNVSRVESYIATGFISTIIKYHKILKELMPVYNVKNKYGQLLYYVVADAKLTTDYYKIKIIKSDVKPINGKIIGVYKSRIKAINFLRQILSTYRLCQRYFIDLSDPKYDKSACFKYHIGECLGACISKESCNDYNKRITDNLIDKNSDRVLMVKENDYQNHLSYIYKISNWEIMSIGEYFGSDLIESAVNIPISQEDIDVISVDSKSIL